MAGQVESLVFSFARSYSHFFPQKLPALFESSKGLVSNVFAATSCHVALLRLVVTLVLLSVCRVGRGRPPLHRRPAVLPVPPPAASQRGGGQPETQLQEQHLPPSEV